MKGISETSTCDFEETTEMPENTNISHKKRNICRFLKMVIFVLSCTGFAVQTTDFLTSFYSYSTVINFGIEEKQDFPLPAITICSKYFYRFDGYCFKLKVDCQSNSTGFEESCQEYDIKCNKQTNITTSPRFNGRTNNPAPLSSREVFIMVKSAHGYQSGGGSFNGPFQIQRSVHGLKDVCYRIGNGLSSTGSLRSFDNYGYRGFWKSIEMSFAQSDNVNFRRLPYGELYLHSPLLAFKSFIKPITVKKHHTYIIDILLEEERLLPSPYDTDCVDYVELWRKNNKSGPLSREMCQHYCRRESEYFESYESGESAYYEGMCKRHWTRSKRSSMPPPDLKPCECILGCKDDCLKLKYELSVFEEPDDTEYYRMPNGKFKSIGEIRLLIRSRKARVLTYKPKYMDVELFSYIGGFIGIWLGISLWSSTGILWKGYSALVRNVKEYRSKSKNKGKPSKQKNPSPGIVTRI